MIWDALLELPADEREALGGALIDGSAVTEIRCAPNNRFTFYVNEIPLFEASTLVPIAGGTVSDTA
jgi:hypothetical protein